MLQMITILFVLNFGECVYLGHFPNTRISNSSVYIAKPSVDGLPFELHAFGENPPLSFINETILIGMINDSYDGDFMSQTRPAIIRNTPGSCRMKFSWYRLPSQIWPRWIKLRTCFDKNYDVPGNVNLCHPTSLIVKTLLRYGCTTTTRYMNATRSCGWYPFYYPFINGCSSKFEDNRTERD